MSKVLDIIGEDVTHHVVVKRVVRSCIIDRPEFSTRLAVKNDTRVFAKNNGRGCHSSYACEKGGQIMLIRNHHDD